MLKIGSKSRIFLLWLLFLASAVMFTLGAAKVYAENGVTEPVEPAFTADGAAIRDLSSDENNGIRFVISMDKTYYAENVTDGVETGVIAVPKMLLGEKELTLDKVGDGTNGNYAIKKVLTGMWDEGEEADTRATNYAYLFGIPADSYDVEVVFRGYLVSGDVIEYTQALTRSMSEVAYLAIQDNAEYETALSGYLYDYDVTFENGEGTAPQKVRYGGKATRPVTDPIKTGYIFKGWFTDGDYLTAFDFENTVIKADTVIYAKWEINVEPVIAMIDALPGAADVTGLDGYDIAAARAAFNALPEDGQSLVSNVDKLVAAEAAYEKYYLLVEDMTSLERITLNTTYTHPKACNLTMGYDSEYGTYILADYDYITGSDHVVLQYDKNEYSDILEGYDNVYFYVYLDEDVAEKSLMADFGGSLKTNYCSLVPGEWTQIKVPVADFLSGSCFGIYGTAWDTRVSQEHKFSAIYAANPQYDADKVIAMINGLPQESAIAFADLPKINSARTAYDALSEAAQALITNYAVLETAEEAFAEKFKVIEDMADTGAFTIPDSTQEWWYHSRERVKLSAVSDEIYGNCLRIEYTGQGVADTGHAVMKFDQSGYAEALAGCEKVYFYVYNGTSGGVGLLSDIQGWANDWYKILQPNSWNLIEISVEDFLKGSIIGIGVANVGEYLISAIYAE